MKTLVLKLACDALSADKLVTAATVREAISEPTAATVHLVTEEDLDPDAAVGAPATLQVYLDDSLAREFPLMVSEVRFEGIHRGRKQRYTVELRHELDFLRLRRDVRIFQNRNAQEIVAKVLENAGIPSTHVAFRLLRTPSTRTYCVQYRETDFDFVSRLLEHEGIFYFCHEDGSAPKVTFADTQEDFPPIEGDTELHLMEDDVHGTGIIELLFESKAVPEKVSLRDYNLETPGVDLSAVASAIDPPYGDLFEYPAGHKTPDEGGVLRKIRLEQATMDRTVGYGKSDDLRLRAGAWLEVGGASRDALNGKYLLWKVEHRLVAHEHEGRQAPSAYEHTFELIPHATPFRPPRKTPRPRVRGLHSAVVTGPSGSEIHTDSLARMKGKFYWDREGKEDDQSSLWMRVAQLPMQGSMALARNGWEMAIAYEDGDPDRPMAIARMYTAEKTSPYAYPAAKTRMSLQTPTSPGGGKSNELRMEDGGGSMEMFMNASKSMSGQTNNNKAETIAVDEKLSVGVDYSVTVGASQTVQVGGNETVTIAADEGVSIGADRTKSVGGSENVTVSSGIKIAVTGNDSETTGGSHTTLAALGVEKSSKGSTSVTIGGSLIQAAAAGVSVAVLGAKSETIGAAKIAASGKSVDESVVGAYACTVGGVCLQAAGGKREAGTKGVAAITVGGVACANGASKVDITAKKVTIRVLGMANLLGGGGILNLTPASASFGGLVVLDASGTIKLSGNPNLIG